MNVDCQCGAVHFKTPSDKPNALYHCHCTECRKQSASAFGTSAVFTSEGIFPMDEALEEKLITYIRSPKASEDEGSGGMVECYFCKKCGVRIMHRRRNSDGFTGGVVMIKGGLIEGLSWKGGIHIFTRSAVMPIPEGAEQHEGAPP